MKSVQNFPSLHKREPDKTLIKLLSYNVQVGINAVKNMDYFTNSWKHFIPHSRRIENFKRLASLIEGFDIVGLQELDGGSFRSGFLNQAEYIAMAAGFGCWYDKVNRNMGPVARHSMGILSRLKPDKVERHNLPGLPGRGTLAISYQSAKPLGIFLAHLALGKKARLKQIDFLCEIMKDFRYIILMGDLNCVPESEEIKRLKNRCNLKDSGSYAPSFPSWQPVQRLDHILVSEDINIKSSGVLGWTLSDHLPIAMEIEAPLDMLDSSGRLKHAA